jgi:hypothetical protein
MNSQEAIPHAKPAGLPAPARPLRPTNQNHLPISPFLETSIARRSRTASIPTGWQARRAGQGRRYAFLAARGRLQPLGARGPAELQSVIYRESLARKGVGGTKKQI